MSPNQRSLRQVELGRSGIHVSEVILGTVSIGGAGSVRATWGRYGMQEDQAGTVMDAGLAFGITALDTATTYAGGESERVVGRWLDRTGAPMVVATKMGLSTEVGGHHDLSRDNILNELPASLARLGLERVDLFLSHAPDDRTPIGETLEAFASLIEQGLVGAVGASNITPGLLQHALDEADRLGLPRYEWVQNSYNLLEPGDASIMIPLCRDRGLGYTPHSPLCGGILTGKYLPDGPRPEGSRMSVRSDYDDLMTGEMLGGVQEFAVEDARMGVTPAALALGWVLGHTGVTAPIVGPREPGQFADIRTALDLRLDQDQRDRLSAMIPVAAAA